MSVWVEVLKGIVFLFDADRNEKKCLMRVGDKMLFEKKKSKKPRLSVSKLEVSGQPLIDRPGHVDSKKFHTFIQKASFQKAILFIQEFGVGSIWFFL